MKFGPEDYKALPYALVGAAEGVLKYYVRPLIADGLKRILPIQKPEAWEDRFFED